MMFFLSTRLRRWLFAVLILPLVGRVLEKGAVRVAPRNARAGRAMTGVGQTLQSGGRKGRRR